MTEPYTIENMARGMYSFQIHGKWARLENLLRVALDIPLPCEAGDRRKASIPSTFVEGLKVLLKMFKVDETGVINDPDKFNKNGFRKSFYNEFRGKIWCGRRTIARMVRAFKDAGILDTYQEVNPDGSMGAWWTRLNAWRLVELLEKLAEKNGKKRPLPCDNECQPLSSPKAPPEVAVATPGLSDSEKKGIISPGGDDSKFKDPTTSFSNFARQEILKTDTGKVLEKLKQVIPEFNQATTKQLHRLHNLVHHFVPALRLNEEMVKSLSETISYNPEVLERFSKIGNPGPFDELGVVDTFLKFWPGISRKLWTNRLSKHDQNCYDDRYAIDEMQEELFSPVNPKKLDADRKQDPASYWIRCLALALTGKWSAAVMAIIAMQARGYLMRRPVVYAIIQARFPQIGRVCNIPERCHKKLMNQALMVKTRINVWAGIQETYGFEYIPTPFERLREGGVSAHP